MQNLPVTHTLITEQPLPPTRLAPKGDEDKRQEHLAEVEEALVRPNAQLTGLLQELRTQLLQDGDSGPQLPLLRHSAGRTRASGDWWEKRNRGNVVARGQA